MKVSIHQPHYLPWLGYFYKIQAVDKFVILDNVQYQRRGFQSRNKIGTRNGEQWLTLPILKKGKYDQLINECVINQNEKWQKKHWLSIEHAYKKSPFYSRILDMKPLFYDKQYLSFFHLTYDMLLWFNDVLEINTDILLSSAMNNSKQGSELILEICKKLKADEYLSGGCGSDYMDLERFNNSNITVQDCSYVTPVYNQKNNDFIPNLSILDLLVNEEYPLDIIISGHC